MRNVISYEICYVVPNQEMFHKYNIFSLLTKRLRGPVEMTLQNGFGPRAVVWRPQAYANNSGRNLELKRFGFRICIIFCNIFFGLDLNLKNLNHSTGMWKRLKVTV